MSEYISYKELGVWKQARVLVKLVYEMTNHFPMEEQFGLTNQLRRAAISVPSNIGEGCGRNYAKDSIQFFYVARGSLYEVETQLTLAFDLDFIQKEQLDIAIDQITRCKKLLNGFINYYQNQSNNDKLTTINEIFEEYGNNSK